MAWYIGTVRIFPQKRTGAGQNIIARLQPLSGGTITQKFGYEDPIIKIGAILVGEDDRAALEAMAKVGTAYTLSGNGTNYGDFVVKSFTWEQTMSICQTMRPDLAETSPVFNGELELYE